MKRFTIAIYIRPRIEAKRWSLLCQLADRSQLLLALRNAGENSAAYTEQARYGVDRGQLHQAACGARTYDWENHARHFAGGLQAP